jgi:hypothetical protein
MREISPPQCSEDDPDRHLKCQEALRFTFNEIVEAARVAGWRERETVAALTDLADQYILSMCQIKGTSAIIEYLKRIT